MSISMKNYRKLDSFQTLDLARAAGETEVNMVMPETQDQDMHAGVGYRLAVQGLESRIQKALLLASLRGVLKTADDAIKVVADVFTKESNMAHFLLFCGANAVISSPEVSDAEIVEALTGAAKEGQAAGTPLRSVFWPNEAAYTAALGADKAAGASEFDTIVGG